jgi:hypothetical protein
LVIRAILFSVDTGTASFWRPSLRPSFHYLYFIGEPA